MSINDILKGGESSGGAIDGILNQNSSNNDNETKSFTDRFKKQDNKMEATSMIDQNSSIDLEKKSKSNLVYLVKGIDDNRNAWYYVLVERLKLQMFLKALNDDIIHLEEYGIILYSAYGDEPPEDITHKVKTEYDIK